MKIRNYTTTKTVRQTVQEIQELLQTNKAKSVIVNYEDGEPDSILFSVDTPAGVRGIRLPCEWVKMKSALSEADRNGDIKIEKKWRKDMIEYAKRVAWRQIYHWVDAQMALMATQMVELDQIFLPYMVDHSGKTLYEGIRDRGYLLGE